MELRCKGKDLQVPGQGGKHSEFNCTRQRRARLRLGKHSELNCTRQRRAHLRLTCQRQRDEHTHLASASASHRGAATRLLDQSELDGGSVANAKTCRCLVTAASTLNSRHAIRTVEQPQAMMLDQSELDWSSVAKAKMTQQVHGRMPAAETSTCTLPPPPPRTVEQPQACSISRSLVAAPLQKQRPASAWSWRQAL